MKQMRITNVATILSLIILLLFTGCSESPDKATGNSYDIISQFLVLFKEASHDINLQENGFCTWAIGKSANIFFYSYNEKENLTLEITCKSISSANEQKQLTKVLLNGEFIDEVAIEADKYKTYTMNLPFQLLKQGRNLLEFNFSYTTMPNEQDSKSNEMRELAVSIKRLEFKNQKPQVSLTNNSIEQKNGVALQIMQELPKVFELKIGYRNLNGAQAFFEILGPGQKNIKIVLPTGQTQFSREITLGKQGVYEIRLSSSGSIDSQTIWENIGINAESIATVDQVYVTAKAVTDLPNIFLYVIDTLRADHLGCYGYGRDTSPNIDEFAKKNALFGNAFSTSSWTKPSGASILTGLLPKKHKTFDKKAKLPGEIVTLAEVLQENGYQTVAITTNEFISKTFGFDQGFDKFIELLEVDPKYLSVKSDQVNRELLTYIDQMPERDKAKPLFCLIWTTDPHSPYAPYPSVANKYQIDQYEEIDTYDFKLPEKIISRRIRPTPSQVEFIKARYDQEIFFNDSSFGKLIIELKRRNLYDHSVMFVLADHGEEFFEHGGFSHGSTLYNEIVKVPFLVKADFVEKGLHPERVQSVDIFPTILDVLRIRKPYLLDGVSLLRNKELSRTIILEQGSMLGCEVASSSNNLAAIMYNDKKLIFTKQYSRSPSKEKVPTFELYDILNDKDEQNNLGVNSGIDRLFQQKMIYYILKKEDSTWENEKTRYSPELDKKLKDLGYVK